MRNDSDPRTTELRMSAERLGLALESAHAGMWEWDLATNDNFWSPELWEVYGVERDSCAASYDAWKALVHPEDVEESVRSIRVAVQSRSELEFEWRRVGKDGAVHWLLSRGRPILDEQGALTRYIGIVLDISGRKAYERRITQLQRIYAMLSQINQTIVRTKTRDKLYRSIADVSADFGGFFLTSVAVFDDSFDRLRLVAVHGREIQDMPFQEIPIHDPMFRDTPYARAIREAKVATSWDVRTDGGMAAWKGRIGARDGIALAVVPFSCKGFMAGVLSLCSDEPGFFTDEQEIKLLEEVGMDITFALDAMETEAERRREEQLRNASEEMYRLVTESTEDWIYWRAPDRSFRYCSPSVEKLTGYGPAEFLEDPGLLERIVHPDDLAGFLEHLDRYADEICDGIDFRIVRKDGVVRWIRHTCAPILVDGGVQAGRRGTNQDWTERFAAEKALRESEDRLSTLFDASPDAMFVTDLDGRILMLNRIASERYGYSAEELRRMSGKDMAPDDMKGLAEGLIQDAVATGRPVELVSVRKDGSRIREEVVFRRVELDGRPCLFSSARDIMERVESEQRTQLQLQRLRALHAIDMMIASNFEVKQTLNLLLDQVVTQLHADAAAILLAGPDGPMLSYVAGRGFHSRAVQSLKLLPGDGLAGKVAHDRRIHHIASFRDADPGPQYRAMLPGEGFVAYFGAPLIAKGQVKGVLEVYHRSALDPDADWVDFLETLAGQAALAIDYAQLFTGLQKSNSELAEAYEETIEGWSRAMELRDQETEGHTRRATELTVRLALAAGIPKEQLVHVRHGALLHDIGKLGVPDSILLKAGPLDEDELRTIRCHPQCAYDLLSTVAYLKPALEIPFCHHERWDGTGYPRGLKGMEIPLAARLFAVVDVWDALRSDRPYRKGWNETDVLAKLREESGRHFDPAAVDLFLKVLEDFPIVPEVHC